MGHLEVGSSNEDEWLINESRGLTRLVEKYTRCYCGALQQRVNPRIKQYIWVAYAAMDYGVG